MKKRRWIIAVLVGVFVVLLKTTGPYVFVVNSVPGKISLTNVDRRMLAEEAVERIGPVSDDVRGQVLGHFADRNTDTLAFDNRSGVVHLTRTILANLSLHRHIERSNQLLQKIQVWGNAGSSWGLNKAGDYDFALIWMTSVLYEFGDDESILYPESKKYLLDVLLTEEGRLKLFVPRSGGLVFDTENHLLMREGSRYLKNQWLKAHGDASPSVDNDHNGLGDWLEAHLNYLRLRGTYEYNSTPYVVYSVLPLMNLTDYAESKVIRRLAEAILDNIALRFAYGSYGGRQCAPFRRQMKYAGDPSLRLNRFGRLVQFRLDPSTHHNDLLVFSSMIHDYHLPVGVYERLANRPDEEYYALFAHEQKGSPEIYSGGRSYLLSAGGAYRGNWAKVIARPIALLLEDDAGKLSETIHINGVGDWKTWNMTGVHRRFAAARGTVVVPQRYGCEIVSGWNVLRANDGVTVAFYQGAELAMLAVVPDSQATDDDLVRMLQEENPFPEQSGQFNWPVAIAPGDIKTITFDIDAPADQWVITAVDQTLPSAIRATSFEDWPFMLLIMDSCQDVGHFVEDFSVGGEDLFGQAVGFSGKIGDGSAGFGGDKHSGGDVVDVEVQFP